MSRRKTQKRVCVRCECEHVLFFNNPYPRVNDLVYCVRCNKNVLVVAHLNTYTVDCVDCSYHSDGYFTEPVASIAAVRHNKKYPTHSVRVTRGAEIEYTINTDNQLIIEFSGIDPLPIDPDTIPF